jgi:hypothetical protein
MTTHYAVFDAAGKAQAFYNSAVYPPQEDGSRNEMIPVDAVEITAQQFTILSTDPTARYVDGDIVHLLPPAPMPGSQYDWGPTLGQVIGAG